jgi:hypothetical protein
VSVQLVTGLGDSNLISGRYMTFSFRQHFNIGPGTHHHFIGPGTHHHLIGPSAHPFHNDRGTAVAQWLRYCATNRKVAGSIPDGVIGIFH